MRCAWALFAIALPTPALAQSYQCTPPVRLGPLPAPRPDGPRSPAPIGRYTLAVSWAPEFCRNDRDPGSIECSGKNGRFGFILHGLWPESNRGPAPQWCALLPRPSAQTLRQHLCMTPVPTMLEHEWAKHGSCMARTPEMYFSTAAGLWRTLRWPDADRLARQPGLTVGDLRSEVSLANPGWRPEWIGVVTSRTGWLRELRLCYSLRFRPMPCPRPQLGPAAGTPLRIWRGL